MSTLGTPVKIVGILTTILLLIVVNPWFQIPEEQAALRDVVTYAFWISFVVLLVMLFRERKQPGGETVEIEGPAFARFLFNNSKAGLFWLPIRLYLGFSWLDAGWHKFTDPDGVWVGAASGTAIRGYWERAAAIPAEGRPAISYEWYRGFIQFLLDSGAESWMTYVITFGEIAVGIGLIFGVLTGFAAFSGALMNMSFLLAGSASTNPVMFTLAVGVILGWKVAGYYGVDRWLLPMLGTPWHPVAVTGKETKAAETQGAGSPAG